MLVAAGTNVDSVKSKLLVHYVERMYCVLFQLVYYVLSQTVYFLLSPHASCLLSTQYYCVQYPHVCCLLSTQYYCLLFTPSTHGLHTVNFYLTLVTPCKRVS